MVMRLRVEYAYDAESHNWSFRVPSLGIVGGADKGALWPALGRNAMAGSGLAR